MKTLARDLRTTIISISGIFAFIIAFGDQSKDLLINNHIISISGEGISITFFDDVIWYVRGILILSGIVYFFLGYKYFKSFFTGDSNYTWPILFSGWLVLLLMIVHELTTPVPWYGFAFGLFCIFLMFWILVRTVSKLSQA